MIKEHYFSFNGLSKPLKESDAFEHQRLFSSGGLDRT